MRVYAIFLPVLFVYPVVCSAEVPKIVSPLTEGSSVIVTTTPWVAPVASATLGLYIADADGKCTVPVPIVPANAVKLSDGSTSINLPPGTKSSTLNLAAPLTVGQKICAYEIDTPATVPPATVSQVVTIAAADSSTAPSIASASAGSKTVAVKSPPLPVGKNAQTASLALYTVDPGKQCSADKPLATVPGTSTDAKPSASITLTLTAALVEGDRICAIESFKDADEKAVSTENSNVVTVTSLDANWGRVRAYFVGGILITNDSSAFSSAHQFYDLTVEKTWHLPYCYLHIVRDGKTTDECATDDASAVEETSAKATVDVSGGTLIPQHPISVSGGSITLVSPIKIANAVATVTGIETISLGAGAGAPTITLGAGESFTIVSGTLSGASANVVPGGIQIPSGGGGVLAITKGSVNIPGTGIKEVKHKGFQLHWPGYTSYFETRLTAIPVASNGTNTTCPPSSTGASTGGSTGSSGSSTATACPSATASSGSSGSSANSGASTASSSTSSFLTSQQTANVTVGAYLPLLLTRWEYNNKPNALFVAPMSKIGFNTLTGPTSQTVVLPGGSPGTETLEQIYNYYSYGARVGHYGLTTSSNVSPEIYSYIDFVFGRYSNLESLICHTAAQRGKDNLSGSDCETTYGSAYAYDSRKRLYRMDLEGLLKIPNTPMYVGLNANIGQKSFQAEKLDPAFKAPDDIRFLFGTKVDIAKLFSTLGVKLP